MTRMPFKMLPSRRATLRCDGRFVVGGRASFVWETLLQRRVAGVPGVHEIRRGEQDAPWHRVDLTIEEAEQMLTEWYGKIRPKSRVDRVRRMRESRRDRGLPVG